jgi:large subunit ribosomal protein L20
MARVKRGTLKTKRRRNILAQTKGYRFDRSRKERVAHEAIRKAGQHAFRDRRAKKREFRNLWTLRVNAAARMNGISYSKLMGAMKKANIGLDRKSLAELAMNHPEAFARVIQNVTANA